MRKLVLILILSSTAAALTGCETLRQNWSGGGGGSGENVGDAFNRGYQQSQQNAPPIYGTPQRTTTCQTYSYGGGASQVSCR
jgi:hypothetical protein